ncbi:MAG: ATP-binding domain-containing protein [Dethiobacter sp.]|nr:ATP-binding domain-containing protein [Dethiobacter sp.]MBS4054872.1 ATP-binding domain-containing protein [Thermaerobacter sp.]
MGTDAFGQGFQLLPNAPSGYSVTKSKSADEDNPRGRSSKDDVAPFQVAYAVSIHKSQGLEYDSVKIVTTDEVDELITHNNFCTAITRTRGKLKIYWTPEVEKKVLESIRPKNIGRDVLLLRNDLCDQG